jgi:glycosyltransferase involved in cell wall biosynthesis
VVLPGFVERGERVVGAFDLFLMPSRTEGYGLTLAEAMAQGVPILASPVDSLPGLLKSYPAGELLDFESAPAGDFIAAVLRMMGTPRAAPHTTHTIDAMVTGYETLYRELVNDGTASSGSPDLPGRA